MLCQSPAVAKCQVQQTDTASINLRTREAYIIARQNPDLSILNSHRAIKASGKIEYSKGIADASLALGMAYLAKYNPGDSATYYNHQALDLYSELTDIIGQARACYGLSYVYSFKGNLSESEKYGSLSLSYFEQAGDKRGMVNALSTVIYLARQMSSNEKALDLTDRAIETARFAKDTNLLADAINTQGNIFKDMLLFHEAIDSYFEALELWEFINDSSGLSIAYGSIGLMYYYQEEFNKALEFNFMKLPLSEKSGNNWEVSKTLNNISQIYSALSKHDSSLFYLRRSLEITEHMNLPAGVASVCSKIALTLLQKYELDSASFYINRAVVIAEEIEDPALGRYLVTKGQVLRGQMKYGEALQEAENANSIIKKTGDPGTLVDAYALLSDLYHQLGENGLAYKYLVNYHNLRDSITSNEYLKKITRLEIQNEYDRKLKTKEYEQMQAIMSRETKIKQQNLFVRGLILLMILLGIISVLYIRQTRLRSKFVNIDLEQRLLRAQMNPHFIFNSLCAVQDFILENKPVKANAFLVKIASLMRNILENSREEYISLDKEIETLKLYLDIQQLRFEEKFEYVFNIDDSIDIENISVPPMLAQPCLENSIEHGLLPQKARGRLEVSYTLKNDLLMLEVLDNGVGRKLAASREQSRIKKKSISTKLTQSRLEYFRKTLKKKNISYEIIDLYNNMEAKGTKVVMIMPCKLLFA
ncbi:MAG: histidine kinase, partial [Bacteroidales bacterium]|nr:histidine kinase [Bacteroidales bacterium]